MENHIRSALTAALRARDAVAVSALRSALSALANAAAVPAPSGSTATAGPIAGAAAGVGATEVPRRALTVAQQHDVLAAEVDERRTAAATAAEHGLAGHAARLLAEADVLSRLLPGT